MAFVLIALMILFAIVGIFFLSYSLSGLKTSVALASQEEALALVRKIAATPEFSWNGDGTCTSCIDFDKALILKERKSYDGFWNLDYLAIEIFSNSSLTGARECTRANYPDCTTLTIKNSSEVGTPVGAFVVLCRREFSGGSYTKCDLGKIYASGKVAFND